MATDQNKSEKQAWSDRPGDKRQSGRVDSMVGSHGENGHSNDDLNRETATSPLSAQKVSKASRQQWDPPYVPGSSKQNDQAQWIQQNQAIRQKVHLVEKEIGARYLKTPPAVIFDDFQPVIDYSSLMEHQRQEEFSQLSSDLERLRETVSATCRVLHDYRINPLSFSLEQIESAMNQAESELMVFKDTQRVSYDSLVSSERDMTKEIASLESRFDSVEWNEDPMTTEEEAEEIKQRNRRRFMEIQRKALHSAPEPAVSIEDLERHKHAEERAAEEERQQKIEMDRRHKEHEIAKEKVRQWREQRDAELRAKQEEEEQRKREEEEEKREDIRRKKSDRDLELKFLKLRQEERKRMAELETQLEKERNRKYQDYEKREQQRLINEFQNRDLERLREKLTKRKADEEEELQRQEALARAAAPFISVARDFTRLTEPTTAQQARLEEIEREKQEGKQSGMQIVAIQRRAVPSWRQGL